MGVSLEQNDDALSKEVSLIGATFYGNRGAEAMLCSAIGELRERNSALHFNVFSYYPEKDRLLVSDSAVSVYSATPFYLVCVLLPGTLAYRFLRFLRLGVWKRFLPESVCALARSKVMICLAGVSFVDGREKFIPFNVATILPAMLLGVPVVKFSQALGPFCSAANKWVSGFFLRRCQRVFARGGITKASLDSAFSVSGPWGRADDIAFLYRPTYSISRSEANVEPCLLWIGGIRNDTRVVVGVCPSVVVAKRRREAGLDYAKEISELIIALVQEGHAVVLFPNATRGDEPDKTHNNDIPLITAISKTLPPEIRQYVQVVDASLNVKEIHWIVSACDLLLTSRFHAMVIALCCAKPVLVLGWSHKYLEVMTEFSQQDMVFDASAFDVGEVMRVVRVLICERKDRAIAIAGSLDKVRRSSAAQIDYVVSLLGDSS